MVFWGTPGPIACVLGQGSPLRFCNHYELSFLHLISAHTNLGTTHSLQLKDNLVLAEWPFRDEESKTVCAWKVMEATNPSAGSRVQKRVWALVWKTGRTERLTGPPRRDPKGSQGAVALSERHPPGKALDQVCRTVS